MQVPRVPKIYHIVHIDRLPSIIQDGFLWSDSHIVSNDPGGTTIGMNRIKKRRLEELELTCYPDLRVGACVPFYFCPRSIMLYMISKRNHQDMSYTGGQSYIIHLQADFYKSVKWAITNNRRWVFTDKNAGAYYFEDYNNFDKLNKLDWEAINSLQWQNCKDGKQAEFLIEEQFPWSLFECIGVYSQKFYQETLKEINSTIHKPNVTIKRDWYY